MSVCVRATTQACLLVAYGVEGTVEDGRGEWEEGGGGRGRRGMGRRGMGRGEDGGRGPGSVEEAVYMISYTPPHINRKGPRK